MSAFGRVLMLMDEMECSMDVEYIDSLADAPLLRKYADLRKAAIAMRLKGHIYTAQFYERRCQALYDKVADSFDRFNNRQSA